MIKFALIVVAVVTIIGLFIPDKYLPKPKPRKRRYGARESYDRKKYPGLPWFSANRRRRDSEQNYRID